MSSSNQQCYFCRRVFSFPVPRPFCSEGCRRAYTLQSDMVSTLSMAKEDRASKALKNCSFCNKQYPSSSNSPFCSYLCFYKAHHKKKGIECRHCGQLSYSGFPFHLECRDRHLLGLKHKPIDQPAKKEEDFFGGHSNIRSKKARDLFNKRYS